MLQPIRNKNGQWPPCFFPDQNKMKNFCRGPSHVNNERKFKQWWSTIPPISTKQTIISHLDLKFDFNWSNRFRGDDQNVRDKMADRQT